MVMALHSGATFMARKGAGDSRIFQVKGVGAESIFRTELFVVSYFHRCGERR